MKFDAKVILYFRTHKALHFFYELFILVGHNKFCHINTINLWQNKRFLFPLGWLWTKTHHFLFFQNCHIDNLSTKK